MINDDVLKDLTIEDLPPSGDLRLVAESCGLDTAIKLFMNAAGLRIYIPRNSLDLFKRQFIHKYHKRFSPKELALKLGVTDAYVYNVLREKKIDTATMQIDFDTEITTPIHNSSD